MAKKSSLDTGPVIVFGMHRAGTSLVANILDKVGVSMGDKFLSPDGLNPNGYYEDEDFLWINKGILEHAGGVWYSPPSVENIKETGVKFREAIHTTVEKKKAKAGKNLWGWKDPRMCLTCWTYGIDIAYARHIVVVRNLRDIKKSLNKAHGYLADWDSVIDAYYTSVEHFLGARTNLAMNISFEELIYPEYALQAVQKLLDFVDKPRNLEQKALRAINFR